MFRDIRTYLLHFVILIFAFGLAYSDASSPGSEIGDAVFRPLAWLSDWIPGFPPHIPEFFAGHAAIYRNSDSNSEWCPDPDSCWIYEWIYGREFEENIISSDMQHSVIQANGDSLPLNRMSFDFFLAGKPQNGRGWTTPYSLNFAHLDLDDRRRVLLTAWHQYYACYPWPPDSSWIWPYIKTPNSHHWSGDGFFRCGGLVEYSYEQVYNLQYSDPDDRGFFTEEEERQCWFSNEFPFIPTFYPYALMRRMIYDVPVKPKLVIYYPESGTKVSGDFLLILAITDYSIGSGIDKFIIYCDNTMILEEDHDIDAVPDTTALYYILDSQYASNGKHSLWAIAWDRAGNCDTSNVVEYYIYNEDPGKDHPDDNEAAGGVLANADGEPKVVEEGGQMFPGLSPCAIYVGGYAGDCGELLYAKRQPVFYTSSPFGISNLLNQSKVLMIPTGALVGRWDSDVFKADLEEFVQQGGTLVCFAQQHGYEYSILPTPDGRPITGYGWLEDQNCQSQSVYIDTYHQILSGQTDSILDVVVDGYFNEYPDSSTVLLRRTKNGYPAMILYPYGQGLVIASTIYEDWGFSHYMGSNEGKDLVRDIASWSRKSMTLLEYSQDDSVDVPISIINNSGDSANQVDLLLLDPDRNLIDTVSIDTTVAVGDTIVVDYMGLAHPPYGIWWVDYRLLQDSMVVQTQREGGQFVVSNPPAGSYRNPDFQIWATTPEEHVVSGSYVTFTIHVKNNSDTAFLNGTIGIGAHEARREGGRWWVFRDSIPDINIPAHSEQVYAYSEVIDLSQSTYFGLFEDGQTPNTFFLSGSIGRCQKGVWVIEPAVEMMVQNDSPYYQSGDTVYSSIYLMNQAEASYSCSLQVLVFDPNNQLIDESDTSIYIPPNDTTVVTDDFTLSGPTGIYLVHADVLESGRLIGSGNGYLEVPSSLLNIAPAMPSSWWPQQDNQVSFQIENVGIVDVENGELRVELYDPDNLKVFDQAQGFALPVNQTIGLYFTISLPQAKFGDYHLRYTKTDEFRVTTGDVVIPCSNLIGLNFDRSFYRIRETMNPSLSLTNSGDFVQDFTAEFSIPEIGYSDVAQVGLEPGEDSTLTYQLLIPSTLSAGGHEALISLSMANTTSDTFIFSIQESEIKMSCDSTSYAAGDSALIKIENSGGVDTQYDCQLSLKDNQGRTISSDTLSDSLRVGDSRFLRLGIPTSAIDGGYTMEAQATDLGTDAVTSLTSFLDVDGVNAGLSVSTDQEFYGQGEPVTVEARVVNQGLVIEGDTLDLKIIGASGTGEMTWDNQVDWEGGVMDSVVATANGELTIEKVFFDSIEAYYVDAPRDLLVSSDFNLDGYPDLAVSTWSYPTYSVAILMNQRDGTFQEAVYYEVGNYPYCLVSSDLNVDGYPDLVVTNTGSNFISVLINKKDGTFEPAVSYDLDFHGYYLVASDFNLDSFPDLAVTSNTSYDSVATLRNNGNGTFASPINYFAAPFTPYIVSSDINSDGYQDLVMPYLYWVGYFGMRDSICVMLNKGDGTFNPKETYYAGKKTDYFLLPDLNSNGYPDVVCYESTWGFSEGDFTILYNNENGTFSSPTPYELGSWLTDIKSSDFNLDGSLDLAVMCDTTVVVLLNKGDGTFQDTLNAPLSSDGFYLNPSDFDLDGDVDLAITTYSWWSDVPGSSVLLNNGDGYFSSANYSEWGLAPIGHPIPSDFDLNGNLDLAMPLSDAVGISINRNQYLTRGIWKDNIDAGHYAAFETISWLGEEHPDTTNLKFRTRTAMTEAGLDQAAWSDYYEISGSAITSPAGRWIEVEATLETNYPGETPVLDQLRIDWTGGQGETILWEDKIPMDLAPGDSLMTNRVVDSLTATGKFYAVGRLFSPLGQDLGWDSDDFYVFPPGGGLAGMTEGLTTGSGYIALTTRTDREAYRPQEIISIDGEVVNLTGVNQTGLVLEVKADSALIYQETFNLAPGDTHFYNCSTVQDSSFLLSAGVGASQVNESIVVTDPQFDITLDAPSVVGQDSFDVNLELHNIGQIGAVLDIDFDGTPYADTIPVGEDHLIQQHYATLHDTVITVMVSGDYNATMVDTVIFGQHIDITIMPDSLYPEGDVVVPYLFKNTGELPAAISVAFSLEPGAVPLDTVENYLSVGDSIAGSIYCGNLMGADYVLNYSCLYDSGSANLSVKKFDQLEVQIALGEKANGGQPIEVEVTNVGANRFTGNLRIDAKAKGEENPYWSQEHSLQDIAPGGAPIFADTVDLAAATQDTNLIVATVYKGDGNFLQENNAEFQVSGSLFTVVPPQFNMSRELGTNSLNSSIPAPVSDSTDITAITAVEYPFIPTFQPGSVDSFRFIVQNSGDKQGRIGLNLKVFDTFDQTQYILLSPGQQDTLIFGVLIPDDLERKVYAATWSVEEGIATPAQGEISFNVAGLSVGVAASLDARAYYPGQVAHLTLDITNRNSDNQPNLFAKVHYADFDTTDSFTLISSQVLAYDIPVVEDGGKLFYGVYHEDGRSLFLNTLYIYEADSTLTITTDKQVYQPGDLVEASAFSIYSDTLYVNCLGYSDTLELQSGKWNSFSFTLPSVMISGTYKITSIFREETFTYDFDVEGLLARILECQLDSSQYESQDTLEARLTIEANNDINTTIEGYLEYPDGSEVLIFNLPSFLNQGIDTVTIDGLINTEWAGIHQLWIKLYADTLLLTSINNSLDIGDGLIMDAKAEEEEYPFGTESVQTIISLYGEGTGQLELYLDGDLLSQEAITLDGYQELTRAIPISEVGAHNILARLLFNGLKSEKDISLFYGSALPDLFVEDIHLNLPDSGVAGTLQAYISNNGQLSAGSFNIDFYYRQQISDSVYIGSIQVDSLQTGSFYHEVEIPFDLNATGGSTDFSARIDPYNLINETDENNNLRSNTLNVPLILSDLYTDKDIYVIGEDVKITSIVTNLSPDQSFDSLNVQISIIQGGTFNEVYYNEEQTQLLPGEELRLDTIWNTTNADSGGYMIIQNVGQADSTYTQDYTNFTIN